jgi:hypothetical protein
MDRRSARGRSLKTPAAPTAGIALENWVRLLNDAIAADAHVNAEGARGPLQNNAYR